MASVAMREDTHGQISRDSVVIGDLFGARADMSGRCPERVELYRRPASMARYSMAPARPQMACGDLLSLSDETLTLLSARLVPASADAPEHCRVAGVISPEVRIEVNLPTAWNRRFYMNGNGGFAGETPETLFRPLYRAAALRQGFATATTNSGHDASEEPLASFAGHNLQKRIDYAFRAVHVTAITAKRIAASYFGRPPAFSYWDGCSTGGRQGLMEA